MKVIALAVLLVAASAGAREVVSLERTVCFGACPAYRVAIHDDGSVRWDGKSDVAVKGRARGKIDRAKVQALVDAFTKARFLEMNEEGEIPPPRVPGQMELRSVGCTDTSHAITTFRQGKKTHRLDDAHCHGANALTALEHLVDETAGSRAFIDGPASQPASRP
jgi:hypothetical protein